MLNASHLLVVEDDHEIRGLIARSLRDNGWRVSLARDGREMDSVLAAGSIDLIVLDVMLPAEDGFSLCRRLRVSSTVPILMISAKGDDIDRVVGLEIGADDFLAKPFNPRELVARVRALLRRSAIAQVQPAVQARQLRFGGWTLDTRLRTLENPDGAFTTLTPAEFDLLRVMCERAGRVLTRDQLLDLTQGRAAGPNERSIDILVSRLRRKIEPDPAQLPVIRTVRSGGYEFMAEVVAE